LQKKGYLVIKARLPTEQGAAVIKAIEAARDILWNERKSVAAETLSGNIIESQRVSPLYVLTQYTATRR